MKYWYMVLHGWTLEPYTKWKKSVTNDTYSRVPFTGKAQDRQIHKKQIRGCLWHFYSLNMPPPYTLIFQIVNMLSYFFTLALNLLLLLILLLKLNKLYQ